MNKSEAITLLAACVPLAHKLAAQGVEIELTRSDQAALQGFKQVGLESSKWLGDPEVYTTAGLNTSLLALLDFKSRLEVSKGIRRKHPQR